MSGYTIHQAPYAKRGETWKDVAQRLAKELQAANGDGERIRIATVIEIIRERLNLSGDQRAYSWHEIQYVLDGLRALVPAHQEEAREAARWRWWQRWWCDGRDDMERINGLEYEGEDPASMNAAVDAEIKRDGSEQGDQR